MKKKYRIEIAAEVPVYGSVEVEADDKIEANKIAVRIARQGWKDPDLPTNFEPENDAMRHFEVYSINEVEEEAASPQAA